MEVRTCHIRVHYMIGSLSGYFDNLENVPIIMNAFCHNSVFAVGVNELAVVVAFADLRSLGSVLVFVFDRPTRSLHIVFNFPN